MTTLKNLFEDHGSVWLAHYDKPNVKFFKPICYTENKLHIIGEDNDSSGDSWTIGADHFVLYIKEFVNV